MNDTPKRTMLLRTKQCRQCGLPFSTTSTVAVVHPECRAEYYKIKSREHYSKTGLRNRATGRRERHSYLLNESACESCGYKLLTKKRSFYHPPQQQGEEGHLEDHILCPRCLLEFRLGYLEALTWKQIDRPPDLPAAHT